MIDVDVVDVDNDAPTSLTMFMTWLVAVLLLVLFALNVEIILSQCLVRHLFHFPWHLFGPRIQNYWELWITCRYYDCFIVKKEQQTMKLFVTLSRCVKKVFLNCWIINFFSWTYWIEVECLLFSHAVVVYRGKTTQIVHYSNESWT